MFSYPETPLRVVAAQCNFTVGDCAGNAEQMASVLARHGSADLVVFSELAICGYYPYDLLADGSLRKLQQAALERICEASRTHQVACVVGLVLEPATAGGKPRNGLVLIDSGEIVHHYAKRLLPAYNVFDEPRHFAPGSSSRVVEFRGWRLGFLVCEDAWNGWFGTPHYGADLVGALRQQSPHLIVSVNASPGNLGKQFQREAIVQNIASTCESAVLYVNQVGGQDEIVFDGSSFAVSADGNLAARLPCGSEAQAELTLEGGRWTGGAIEEPPADEELFGRLLVLGLRDYARRTGFKKVVIACSGGIDSALTVALAAEAMGPENVLAITMPSRYSSAGSVEDSRSLCAALGVELRVDPIETLFAAAIADHSRVHGEELEGVARENLQARLRGNKLMAYANASGALPLSCGNKSETATGYFTLYGDSSGGLCLVGDLFKTDVYALAAHLNAEALAAGRPAPIPEAILTKAPSAELAEGQRDSDSLPEYELLDTILKVYLEQHRPGAEEARLLEGAPAELFGRVVALVQRAEFKRRQAPPILRVRPRAFGRGRQMPIAAAVPRPDSLEELLIAAGLNPEPYSSAPRSWK